MPLLLRKKLLKIKEHIEYHGLEGELYGERLKEVYRLVCEMLGELAGESNQCECEKE